MMVHMSRKIGSYGPYIAHSLYAAIIAAGLSTPAHAAPICAGTADAYAQLSHEYGEGPIWRGGTQDGRTLEVWGNIGTQSWTMIISARGITCYIVSGIGFENIPQGKAL
jgi:hypothetical protein